MQRFRVKMSRKKWTDPGPDLLRQEQNAQLSLRAAIPFNTVLFLRKKGEDATEWTQGLTRGEVMDLFRFWQGNGKREEFQVGERRNGRVAIIAQVRREEVPRVPLANCTKVTEELHSLVHFQFSAAVHSGGFLYRQVDGSSDWSDHAWGSAIDESQNTTKGLSNDEVFDWQARMAQSGNINPDYILGSRNGNVMQCVAPDYEVKPSGAASSHLWHVHTSQVDHDGRKPSRNPMVP